VGETVFEDPHGRERYCWHCDDDDCDGVVVACDLNIYLNMYYVRHFTPRGRHDGKLRAKRNEMGRLRVH
jgi:hypothetical protein